MKYWIGVIVNAKQKTQYQTTFVKLLESANPNNGLHVEKLHDTRSLYSLNISEKGQLLFILFKGSFDQNHIVILEEPPTYNYGNVTFLKKDVLKNFLLKKTTAKHIKNNPQGQIEYSTYLVETQKIIEAFDKNKPSPNFSYISKAIRASLQAKKNYFYYKPMSEAFDSRLFKQRNISKNIQAYQKEIIENSQDSNCTDIQEQKNNELINLHHFSKKKTKKQSNCEQKCSDKFKKAH